MSFFVQHAEGDAFAQAMKSGVNLRGQSATVYVADLDGHVDFASRASVPRPGGQRRGDIPPRHDLSKLASDIFN
jgi:hypothetical protein